MKQLLLLLSLSLFTGIAKSQNFNKAKMDSLFDILAEKNKAMGSLSISKKGKVIYSRAIGYSFISESEKTPATEKTRYRIGSISKMFTAVMIFQLIDEKKLTLDTKLSAYFPKFPEADKITIGYLLAHRSGIHNFTNDEAYSKWMTQTKTQEEMLAVMSEHKADFTPNEKAEYSNSNFVLLGFIVEKITGKSLKIALEERICKKADLKETYVGAKTTVKNKESFSYQYTGTWEQEAETDMSIPGGAGAVVSTPNDLNKFIEALFALKLCSQNSLNQMKTINEGYGMGMFQIPYYAKKAFGHNGAIDGFSSNLAYFPADSVSIAYCTNGQAYPMNSILLGVLNIYFNKNYTIPTFKSITLKTEELDKYLGVYTSKEMELVITVTKKNTTLMAQATGQLAFPLEAKGNDVFKFDSAGIEMKFDPANNQFTLKQGGGSFLYEKKVD